MVYPYVSADPEQGDIDMMSWMADDLKRGDIGLLSTDGAVLTCPEQDWQKRFSPRIPAAREDWRR